jgi:hypothetical protein
MFKGNGNVLQFTISKFFERRMERPCVTQYDYTSTIGTAWFPGSGFWVTLRVELCQKPGVTMIVRNQNGRSVDCDNTVNNKSTYIPKSPKRAA